MLASAADDIRVWEGDKFDNIVQHYRPNIQKVSSLVWNSSNTQLASTSPGGCAIGVAYLDSDQDPVDFPVLEEATCLCWHGSSKSIGLGCMDGNVRIYDLKHQITKKTHTGHKAPVTCILYNYNDTSIASASKSGEIILHNTVTDLMTKLMTTLKLQAIQGLQYSYYHHSMLASVSDDASLVLWDTNARRSVHQFTRSHKAPATDLTFSPSNDKLLMSCGLDKNIVLYDVLNKSLVRTMQVDSPLSSITMHPNGFQVASGTIKGQILLHDLRKGSTLQHSFTAHRSSVQCLKFQNRIIPKKSKHSSSSRNASSTHSTTAESQLSDQTAVPSTPLSNVDQNVVLNGNTSQHTKHNKPTTSSAGLRTQEIIEELEEGSPAAALTPTTAAHINGGLSQSHRHITPANSNHNSIFSPDVGGDDSQSSRRPAAVSNNSVTSQQNGSVSKHVGLAESVFSPDVPSPAVDMQRRNQSGDGNRSHHTPGQRGSGLPPRHQLTPNTGLNKYPHNTSNTTATTTTPAPRRELPVVTNGHSAVDVVSDRRSVTKASPITIRSTANYVHFNSVSTASDEDSADAGASGVSGNAALSEQIRLDLKQQLKSELVSEIRDMIDAMKSELKQSLTDHHFEMIKQFYLMEVHVESQTSGHSLNRDLLRENEELKAEIERLKRSY